MEYRNNLNKAYRHAEKVRQKQKLKEIKHSNDIKRKPLTFSKAAVIFVFLNCLLVELYSMVITIAFHDLVFLSAIIVAVIGQFVVLLGYFKKAKQENMIGGITYEKAMNELKGKSAPVIDDDGAVG